MKQQETLHTPNCVQPSFAFPRIFQRYANPEEMGEQFVTREARLQDEKNRQNSIDIGDSDEDGMAEMIVKWEEMQQDVIHTAKRAYDWAIANGIAKEQA